MRNYEDPVVTPKTGPGFKDGTVETHPSYCQIAADRVSGHAQLYGSDFDHQGFISITIRRSEKHRDLSRDWYFGRNALIEVWLSEAQWASFVSGMNVGQGTPCTLNRLSGESVPGLPEPTTDRTAAFRDELQKDFEEAQRHLDRLQDAIDASPLSEKAKKELRGHLRMARTNLGPNMAFVAKSFGEHIETVTEKARVEINGYVQTHIQRAGLAALNGGEPPIRMMGPGEDGGEGRSVLLGLASGEASIDDFDGDKT